MNSFLFSAYPIALIGLFQIGACSHMKFSKNEVVGGLQIRKKKAHKNAALLLRQLLCCFFCMCHEP